MGNTAKKVRAQVTIKLTMNDSDIEIEGKTEDLIYVITRMLLSNPQLKLLFEKSIEVSNEATVQSVFEEYFNNLKNNNNE